MGANSNLFLMLQEQQIETNNFLPTKKEIHFSAEKFVEKTLEVGEMDKMELFAFGEKCSLLLSICASSPFLYN